MLITIALVALMFLAYAWRYVWGILSSMPKALYVIVASLVVTQYLGEHGILFGHDLGVVVEEVSEATIYLIALVYLWRFELPKFEYYLCSNKILCPN
ncbi:hypothetical protein [Psychrobacter lutiphocae]|uniref:hypothetical protein n=1 Tax=Psychrobacter lutiphocae TaxID=540500 RepID=UPI0012EA49D3|nr:hypothetical protein [Psychrobacter lutiphocae]